MGGQSEGVGAVGIGEDLDIVGCAIGLQCSSGLGLDLKNSRDSHLDGWRRV